MGEEKTSEGCIGWFIVLIVVGAISLAWGFTLRNECHHGDHDNALVPGPSGPVQQKIRDPDLYFSVQRASDLYLSELQASDLVVVLSVSLHCRGCEKKLRKHLSKMEGVTSFTIDFMAKKVTVVGNITPLAVLMSVSKVKNAKLLTPTTISSPSEPRMDSSFSKIDEQLGLVA